MVLLAPDQTNINDFFSYCLLIYADLQPFLMSSFWILSFMVCLWNILKLCITTISIFLQESLLKAQLCWDISIAYLAALHLRHLCLMAQFISLLFGFWKWTTLLFIWSCMWWFLLRQLIGINLFVIMKRARKIFWE